MKYKKVFNKCAVYMCENIECEDCPIYKNDIEIRTEIEKINFRPCYDNLSYFLESLFNKEH